MHAWASPCTGRGSIGSSPRSSDGGMAIQQRTALRRQRYVGVASPHQSRYRASPKSGGLSRPAGSTPNSGCANPRAAGWIVWTCDRPLGQGPRSRPPITRPPALRPIAQFPLNGGVAFDHLDSVRLPDLSAARRDLKCPQVRAPRALLPLGLTRACFATLPPHKPPRAD